MSAQLSTAQHMGPQRSAGQLSCCVGTCPAGAPSCRDKTTAHQGSTRLWSSVGAGGWAARSELPPLQLAPSAATSAWASALGTARTALGRQPSLSAAALGPPAPCETQPRPQVASLLLSPALSMRQRSSSRLGLWSCVSTTAWPPCDSTPRESPTCGRQRGSEGAVRQAGGAKGAAGRAQRQEPGWRRCRRVTDGRRGAAAASALQPHHHITSCHAQQHPRLLAAGCQRITGGTATAAAAPPSTPTSTAKGAGPAPRCTTASRLPSTTAVNASQTPHRHTVCTQRALTCATTSRLPSTTAVSAVQPSPWLAAASFSTYSAAHEVAGDR